MESYGFSSIVIYGPTERLLWHLLQTLYHYKAFSFTF